LTIYGVLLLLSMLYAMVVPTLSVFLAFELGIRPLLLGSFFVSVSLTVFFYSQTISLWAERIIDRRKLIFLGACIGGFACFSFAYFRSYALILLAATTLFSLSLAAIAQITAYTREFADTVLEEKDKQLFKTLARSVVALAWFIAAPGGFALLQHSDFSQYYVICGLLYFAAALLLTMLLPEVPLQTAEIQPPSVATSGTPLVALTAAFSLLYAANQCYLLALPLFLVEGLQADSYRAGWLLGTAAGIEIPVMLLCGWLSTRYALMPLLYVGVLAALVLNIATWQASSVWQLYVLQALNAVFIGVLAGVGSGWFKRLVADRGTAVAAYANAINLGGVTGAVFILWCAEWYGYRSLYALNAFAIMAAILLIAFVHRSRCRRQY